LGTWNFGASREVIALVFFAMGSRHAPITSFSRPSSRNAQLTLTSSTNDRREVVNFIAGKTVPGASGGWQDIFNPATGIQSGKVCLSSQADVDAAVAAAQA